MVKTLLIPILTLSLIIGANGVQFSIKKPLDSPYVIDKKYWSDVSVESFGDDVEVKMKIPLLLTLPQESTDLDPDFNVYFANDNKEILVTNLKDLNITGSFFSLPYRLQKSMTGSEIKKQTDKNYLTMEVKFPKVWLPEKCMKISASVLASNGSIYNYYDIGNSKISLPDLMVTEEYKKCEDFS